MNACHYWCLPLTGACHYHCMVFATNWCLPLAGACHALTSKLSIISSKFVISNVIYRRKGHIYCMCCGKKSINTRHGHTSQSMSDDGAYNRGACMWVGPVHVYTKNRQKTAPAAHTFHIAFIFHAALNRPRSATFRHLVHFRLLCGVRLRTLDGARTAKSMLVFVRAHSCRVVSLALLRASTHRETGALAI